MTVEPGQNHIVPAKQWLTAAMPNIKQPKKLEAMALAIVGDWVALQAEQLMIPVTELSQRNLSQGQAVLARKITQIRSYLEYYVPWMVFDTLAREVIRALTDVLEKIKNTMGFRGSMSRFVSQMNIAVAMTEVLFTQYLKVISIDTIPKMMRTIFYLKLHKLTGLVSLNLGSLSGGWKTADMEQSILNSIKTLHRLKNICINYDATDNILRCIGKNCPFIERLDVSCSKNITNESMDILIKYKHLRSVQLYRTSVTLEGYTKLMLNCKYLEDIGRCEEIGRVLEYIDLTNSQARPFRLKTYVSRYAPAHHLQLAVEMCPRIMNMTVFHHTLQGDIMVLVGLPELSILKLLSCDFYADQVKQLLQVKGCNIVSLHLEHVDQIDLNALMYISQMCPVLKSLTLYNCTLIQHTSLYTRKLEILPFRNLKRLTCVAYCTEAQIMFLLSNCLNVEFIHLGTAVQLTDEIVMKILNLNPMIHLKELRIMQSDYLTTVSVERIIHSCMSLEILVELECWSMLTDSDREFIRNYIKINNFNVDTAPIRRYDE